MEECSTNDQLPLINNNALKNSESTTHAEEMAIEMQNSNNNDDDVLWCLSVVAVAK